MNEDRWQQIKALVKDKFQVALSTTEQINETFPGTQEVLEFVGPMGKIRLEWTDQPLVTGKKALAAKRIGSRATIEYQYSETERVHKFHAYQWNEERHDWQELKSSDSWLS